MKEKTTYEHLNLEVYDALNFSGLERRANYRVIAYREDMLHVFEKKDAATVIYQIIYRWLERRRDEILADMERRRKAGELLPTPQEIENRMWVYMSYNDFARESGGAVGYNTAVRALDYLINAKHVLERRENSNPRFTEYEYRIKKAEVCKLLSDLPVFPHYLAKGAKGRETPTQMGSATHPYPNGVGQDPNGDGGYPNGSNTATQTGVGSAPFGGTSQVATQNLSQESSQQQKGTPVGSQNEGESAASATQNLLHFLTEEETALILAIRQQQFSSQPITIEDGAVVPPAPGIVLQASEEELCAPFATKLDLVAAPSPDLPNPTQNSDQPIDPSLVDLARPASSTLLTDVVIVQLWEYLRQIRYTEAERRGQLAAAQELLCVTLPLPLSIDLLERVYTTFLDNFWIQKFRGVMNVSHLVQVERSTGQIRVVRWLSILQTPVYGPSPAPGASESATNGVNYAELVGMKDEARQHLAAEQRARNDQKYTDLGIDREALMAMKPEERIAFLKQRQAQQQNKPATAALGM